MQAQLQELQEGHLEAQQQLQVAQQKLQESAAVQAEADEQLQVAQQQLQGALQQLGEAEAAQVSQAPSRQPPLPSCMSA